MFLRLTWVVGQAGIILTIAIITLSNVVTTITTLSLCAIVTNGEVKGGGAYYLISRALGPTYGGVIGLLFFCAQAVATSMYVIGFSDSIVDISRKSGAEPFTGDFANDQRVISTITMVILLDNGIWWWCKRLCKVYECFARHFGAEHADAIYWSLRPGCPGPS